MTLDELGVEFPSVADYPKQTFDPGMPQGYRVGCAHAYLRANSAARRFFVRRIATAVEMLPDRRFTRALDLGTGAGFYLPVLQRLAGRVCGVDLNPVLELTGQMLRRKGYDAVAVARSDVMRLPFADGRFDLLFCLSVIEHIEDQAAALAEFARVLAPGGVLILGYPLQNLAQEAFEGANKLLHRASLFWKLGPRRALARLEEIRGFAHHHVDDFSQVRRFAEASFEVGETRRVKLLGLTVYELLSLTKPGRPAAPGLATQPE